MRKRTTLTLNMVGLANALLLAPLAAAEVPACIGRIGVIQLYPESDDTSDNTETWDSSRIATVQDEIWSSLEYWSDKAAEAGAELTFVNTTRYLPSDLLINEEPVKLPRTSRCTWINECMDELGYSAFFKPCEQEIEDMNVAHIPILGTDYNFSLFIVDNESAIADGSGFFSDDTGAYAEFGSFAVVLYDNPGYGVSNLDWVVAHELGHICRAFDEYPSSNCSCDQQSNGFDNFNCELCAQGPSHVDCLMKGLTSALPEQNLCYYSQGMVGWSPRRYELRVSKSGTGSGTITSDEPGINCGSDCTEAFNPGTEVTLTAAPAAGSTFTSWGGDCTTASDCTLSMVSDFDIIASFAVAVNQSPPSVDTSSAINVTGATAELRATVTPGGLDTEAWFTWDNDNTPSIQTTRFGVGAGATSQTYSYTIGNLDCETTYFFRAHAQNSAGSDQGNVLSFTTATCSGGGGSGSTDELLFNGDFEDGEDHWVTSGDFYVDAAPNPRRGSHYAFLSNSNWTSGNNLDGTLSQVVVDIPASATAVELSFYYSISTSETTGSSVFDRLRVRVTRFGGTTTTLDTLSNLDATGTSYSRREYDLSNYAGNSINLQFVAETDSSLPTTFRLDDVSLVAEVPAGGPPSVSTSSADQVTETGARLNLSVNPNGISTDVWFEWDDDTNLSFETSSVGVGSATSTQNVSISLFDLECGTTYYFAAVAENGAGSDTGSQRSFTTDSCPGGSPSADTDPAIDVTQTSALLTAEILPNGRSTEAWFEWGTSTNLGNDTPRVSVGSSQSWRSHQQPLFNLDCDTTYYFEAHAENSLGADDGATLSFTTSDCGGGGGEPPPQGFFAWAHRQGCHGTAPAILLEWSPAADAASYTIERLDGAYSAQIDASGGGLAHLVTEGLAYGQSYGFRVLAQNESVITASNIVMVYVIDRECLAAGQPDTPPGSFLPWLVAPTCNDGVPTVELHWSSSTGADSYTLVRHADSDGIKRTVANIHDTSFVDSVDIAPGAGHAYTLEAVNTAGVTAAQLHLDFYPNPDLCDDAGLPGQFVLSVGDPYCANGEPTIPITWTPSSSADDFYRVRARANGAVTGGSGFSTNSYPFAYELTAGVRPGFIHELYMVSFNQSDDTKKRYSNSVFLAVPKDVCGPPSLAPDASTRTAVGVDETGAILRGSVRPNGSFTTAYFEWGTSASYGEQTPSVSVGDALIFVRPSAQLSDLSCGTEYHYRIAAINSHGSTFGADTTLTTGPCPGCGQLSLELSNLSISTPVTYEACDSIHVGPSVFVEAGGALELIAPRVIFGDGFSVKGSGGLRVHTRDPTP